MKQVDKLVIKELFGPWCFGTAIFTVLIMAGNLLFELTKYLTEGISPMLLSKLTLLLLPGVMAKTFPMAVLLAALLAFGRLSGDSEIVALKASGIAVGRIMRPVAAFGLLVFGLAFVFNESLVPWCSLQATQLQDEIKTALEGKSDKPTSHNIYNKDGKLEAILAAQNFNMAKGSLTNAFIILLNDKRQPVAIMYAKEIEYTNESKWRIKGGPDYGSKVIDFESGITTEFKGDVFPAKIPPPDVSPDTLIAEALRNLDVLNMQQTARQMEQLRRDPKHSKQQLANLEFGYWNKITLPLAALVFGLVGAPLGIRNHRTGTATGFSLSVVIIFAYMMLTNMLSIYAQGGAIPPYVASFGPILVGVVTASVMIHKRNK